MKKIEYQAPEMEVVDLKNQGALLSASFDDGTETGGWDPNPGSGPGE